MRVRRRSWLELIRAVGKALLELAAAEIEALVGDLKASGRALAGVLLLFVVAAFFGFWTLGLLFYAAVEALTLWLPRWGAALAVAGAGLLGVAIVAGIGWLRLRRLESPAETVRRRVRDHVGWLQESVLETRPELTEESDLED